jgi:hypothetical protein
MRGARGSPSTSEGMSLRVLVVVVTLLASGLLPVGPAGPGSAAAAAPHRPTVRLVGGPRSTEAGRTVVFGARLKGRTNGETTVELQERTGRGWRTVTDSFHVEDIGRRLRTVPRKPGIHVYRAVLRHVDRPASRVASPPVRVRVTAPAHAHLTSYWFTAQQRMVDVTVSLNRWISDAPSLALQQRRSGRWTTLATVLARRFDRGPWWVSFRSAVTNLGALRVVGSGPGWRVSEPVTSFALPDQEISVDGPAISVAPAPTGSARRVTFAGEAGDDIVLLLDGNDPGWTLYDPAGDPLTTSDNLPDRLVTLPDAGQYSLLVWTQGGPAQVRIARAPHSTTATIGTVTTVPAVSDVRIPRTVTFDADAGDLLAARLSVECSLLSSGPQGTWSGISTGLSSTTGLVIHGSGTQTARLWCPDHPGAVDLHLDPVPVHDIATDGVPVPFTAARYEVVAFRYTTDFDDAEVSVTRQTVGRTAYTWLLPLWDPNGSDFPVQRGVQESWMVDAGQHLLLVQPYDSDESAATISLTARPRA